MTAVMPGELPDDDIERLATEGSKIAEQLAKERDLVIKSASIDEILDDIQFEWLEE